LGAAIFHREVAEFDGDFPEDPAQEDDGDRKDRKNENLCIMHGDWSALKPSELRARNERAEKQ
jgi:hypothetical protein